MSRRKPPETIPVHLQLPIEPPEAEIVRDIAEVLAVLDRQGDELSSLAVLGYAMRELMQRQQCHHVAIFGDKKHMRYSALCGDAI